MHLLTHDASCGEWEMPVTLQGQASGNHRPQHRTALTLADSQGRTSGEGLGELGCELGPSKILHRNPDGQHQHAESTRQEAGHRCPPWAPRARRLLSGPY